MPALLAASPPWLPIAIALGVLAGAVAIGLAVTRMVRETRTRQQAAAAAIALAASEATRKDYEARLNDQDFARSELERARVELETNEARLRELQERLEKTATEQSIVRVIGREYEPPDPEVYGGYSSGDGGGGAYRDVYGYETVKVFNPELEAAVSKLKDHVTRLETVVSKLEKRVASAQRPAERGSGSRGQDNLS